MCSVDVGAVGGAGCLSPDAVSSSRPCLVKTTRRSVIWHSEQIKLWCSKPGTASRTTFIKINSRPHASQRIPCTSASIATEFQFGYCRSLSRELDYDRAYVQCLTPNVSIETVNRRSPGTAVNKPRQVPTLGVKRTGAMRAFSQTRGC